jgi:eukaryotic-like serine/threonine-protein kinase
VKVTDFGIARAADAAPLTKTGTVMGTAKYLSPETASGHPATAASDVYSLGVVAYECLAGSPPFRGDNPVALAMAHVREPVPPLPDAVPPPVRDLVLQCLEKNPALRPASAGELGRYALSLRSDADGTAPVPAPTAVMAGAPQTVAGTHRLGGPGQHAARGERAGRRRGLDALPRSVLAVLVVLGLLLGGLLLSTAFDSTEPQSQAQDPSAREKTTPSPTPTNTPTASKQRTPDQQSPAPRGIEIVSASYEGRDYREVQSELENEGLDVDLKPKEEDEAHPFTVLEVKPEDLLYPGDTVEVEYAVPKRDESGGPGNSGKGGGDNSGPGGGDQGDD